MSYLLIVKRPWESEEVICAFANKAVANSLCAQANNYPECNSMVHQLWYANHPVVQFLERNGLTYLGKHVLEVELTSSAVEFVVKEVASFAGEPQ